MQRASRHLQNNTKKGSARRNSVEDVDEEGFSIQTFMDLVRQGQTLAIDMLFTPPGQWKVNSGVWDQIVPRRSEPLHSGTNAFVGYSKAQAAKYGAKGDRIAALRIVLRLMQGWSDALPLWDKESDIRNLVSTTQNKELEIVNIKSPSGSGGKSVDLPHLPGANKKIGFTSTVQYARQIYQLALKKYGARALQAEQSLGIDWKACMQAIRVAYEAEELLLTSHVTFPRPERDLLLEVRRGELKCS